MALVMTAAFLATALIALGAIETPPDEILVEAGDTLVFTWTVTDLSEQSASFTVKDIPTSWEISDKSVSFDASSGSFEQTITDTVVLTTGTVSGDLTLNVRIDIPGSVSPGEYEVTATHLTQMGFQQVPVSVTVMQTAGPSPGPDGEGDADGDGDVDLDDLEAVLDNLTEKISDGLLLRMIGMWAED